MKLCLTHMDNDVPYKAFEHHSSRVGAVSNGSNMRTRITSVTRSEYHGDLKADLHTGVSRRLVFAAFIVVFGSSFLFGYNIAVLNQPKNVIIQFYNTTYTSRNDGVTSAALSLLWSLTVVMFIAGGVIGALLAGWLSDFFGRKYSLMLSQVFVVAGVVSSTISFTAASPELLIIARVLFGIHSGISNVVAPMYVTEIAPYKLRGAFGAVHQLAITLGIFIASVFGLPHILGTPNRWMYLMVLELVPATVCWCCVPFLYESPRFLLLVKRKREDAVKALKYYYGVDDVGVDIEEMDTEHAHERDSKTTCSILSLVRSREVLMPVLIACALQVIQQFSGINAIIFFSHSIFHAAGVPDESIPFAVCGTNGVNVIMTMIAVAAIDRFGRRLLMLLPMVVMILDLTFITVSQTLQPQVYWMAYVSLVCAIVYVISFAVGLGPIPMMIGAELFRQKTRASAMALTGIVNWTATLIIAVGFQTVLKETGNYTFVIFLILMLVFTVFIFFKMPETKHKTIEEIVHVYSPGGVLDVEEDIDDVTHDSPQDCDVFENDVINSTNNSYNKKKRRSTNSSESNAESIELLTKSDKAAIDNV